MLNIFKTNLEVQEVKNKISLIHGLSITVKDEDGATLIMVDSSLDVSIVKQRLERMLGAGNIFYMERGKTKRAIVINGLLVEDYESKISNLIKDAEVFSGGKQEDQIVVVSNTKFNDAIAKLQKYFGVENVKPYDGAGDSNRENILYNLTAGSTAQKTKEKHFFA